MKGATFGYATAFVEAAVMRQAGFCVPRGRLGGLGAGSEKSGYIEGCFIRRG